MSTESELVAFLQKMVNSIVLGIIIGFGYNRFQQWRRERILNHKTREAIREFNKMYYEFVIKNGKFLHPSPPSSPSDNKMH